MDNNRNILLLLAERRIAFWTDGEDLRYRAPKNAFDGELKRFVSERKAEFVELLRSRAGTPAVIAPLSYGQRAQWFLQQLRPASAAYNIAFALRFLGAFDKDALRKALHRLSAAHGVLHASYGMLAGEAVQCIPQAGEITLEELRADTADAAVAAAEHFTAQPFDLARGPLIRVGIVEGGGPPLLVIGIHHVAIDYWSLALLVEELLGFYREEAANLPPAPKAVEHDYIDYVCGQHRLLNGPQGERLWSYWRKKVDPNAAVTELPTDRPRSRVQGYRGETHILELEPSLAGSLRAAAQSLGVTPNAALLACLFLLLSRYTAEKRPVVGCVATGRTRREHDEIIGYLANPVVVCPEVDLNRGFTHLVQSVHSELLQALEHQDYPFPLLVERLGGQRDPARNPIFQILFDVLSWTSMGSASSAGLEIEPIELTQQEGQFDLSVWVSEHRNGWRIAFKFDADLYDKALVVQWANHFRMLLCAGLAERERPLGSLTMLSDEEQHAIFSMSDGGPAPVPAAPTIHGLIECQVRQHPEALAVVSPDACLTYGELDRRANQLARKLLARNLQPESRIALCAPRTPALVTAMLAILKAGCAYVPLDPNYPRARLEYLLDDSSAQVVLTTSDLAPIFDGRPVPLIMLDEDAGPALDDDVQLPEVRTDQLAYVIYTSGSTGGPKGVAIEHRNTVAYLTWALDWFDAEDLSSTLATISVCFDLSIIDIFLPLAAGKRLVLAQSILDITSEWVKRQEVTMAIAVPSAIRELVRQGLPPTLRTLGLGGEVLPATLVKDIRHHSQVRRIDNIFGPTEITICCTSEKLVDPRDTVPTVGRPLSGYRVYVLDERMQPVPPLVRGEIYVGGVGVTREYLGKPELNALRYVSDTFSDDPKARLFRTGDFARYRRDGRLEFLGREDDQIKLRGFRIQLDEIEESLRAHPAIERAAVVLQGKAHEDGRLVAFCTLHDANLTEGELRDYLQHRLPHYMLPSRIVALDALPTTPNGKIDRRLLRTWSPPSAHGANPTDATEQALLGMWRGLLGNNGVGVEDNFFEVGGHSLLLVRLREEIRKRWGIELEVVDLFRLPNIRALAASVRLPVAPGVQPDPSAALVGEREA